jgi:hypothetical protein
MRLLFGEELGHLTLGGAVDAQIGDGGLPFEQELVLGGDGFEATASQGVALHVADTALDLALVLRGAGPAGDDGDSVVTGELNELWVEFGIVPVGLEDGGLEVVEVEGLGDPVEGPEGVLQGSQEGFGILDAGPTRCRPCGRSSGRCGRPRCDACVHRRR